MFSRRYGIMLSIYHNTVIDGVDCLVRIIKERLWILPTSQLHSIVFDQPPQKMS